MLSRTFVLAASLTVAAPAMAEEAVHTVVNIDLMPSDQAVGTQILSDFVRRTRTDPDVSTVTLVQQFGSSNHFILVETFANRAAYERYVQAGYVRSFRSALHPHLGSPWDERPGSQIAY